MMAPLVRQLLLACAFVAICAVAVFVIADRSWSPPDAHRVDASAFEVVVVDRIQRSPSHLAEIAERPLFAPSRRPPAAVVAVQGSKPAAPIEGAKVLGLFGREGAWGAILSIDGKVRRVRPGEKVDQWSLVKVEGNEIVFENESGAPAILKIVHLPQMAAPPAAQKSMATAASGEAQREAADAAPPPPEQTKQ